MNNTEYLIILQWDLQGLSSQAVGKTLSWRRLAVALVDWRTQWQHRHWYSLSHHKMYAKHCTVLESDARWYLEWSRAVLLSWGLRGGLSSEDKSSEVTTSLWRAGESCLSDDSCGSRTADTTGPNRRKDLILKNTSEVETCSETDVSRSGQTDLNFQIISIENIQFTCMCAAYKHWEQKSLFSFLTYYLL